MNQYTRISSASPWGALEFDSVTLEGLGGDLHVYSDDGVRRGAVVAIEPSIRSVTIGGLGGDLHVYSDDRVRRGVVFAVEPSMRGRKRRRSAPTHGPSGLPPRHLTTPRKPWER